MCMCVYIYIPVYLYVCVYIYSTCPRYFGLCGCLKCGYRCAFYIGYCIGKLGLNKNLIYINGLLRILINLLNFRAKISITTILAIL